MQTRQEAIQNCHSFQDVYEDYPLIKRNILPRLCPMNFNKWKNY